MTSLRRAAAPRLASAAIALAALAGCAGAGPGSTAAADPACAELTQLKGPAREEARAVARLLALRPSMAIDFSESSGEYCLDTGGGVMTHFSARPSETAEDVVYFIDASPMVARGLRLADFPALDPALGAMQPNTWYRYEGQGDEPHHGRVMSDRTWLMMSVDIK